MMNDSKTEFVIVVSSGSVDKVSIDTITIGDLSVSPSGSARNIGDIFDKTLCLNDHITNIPGNSRQSSHLHMRTG